MSSPTTTAQNAALVRAAHQVFDQPHVFEDALATVIAGEDAEGLAGSPEQFQTAGQRHVRAFMAARSRLAEDELALAVMRGASQYVILGAGLDTYAYRNADAATPKVFEVDHSATQGWKRGRLAAAGIAIPPSLVFVTADLERGEMASALSAAGLDRNAITFFSALGVAPYLSATIVTEIFEHIAQFPTGSGLVFDYAVAREALTQFEQIALDVLMRRVAKRGEPFRSFFVPSQLAALLDRLAYRELFDLGPAELDARYFCDRSDGLRVAAGLARIVTARL